jgi:hypothetical protein
MSVLNRIAHFQNRRDEAADVELARALASQKDKRGIAEIAANLWNKNKDIQGDCLKVLYEIGALNPELIADYADDFLKLLKSKNNRLVWGSMTALAAIATLKADVIAKHLNDITGAMNTGSVITVDNGVKTLALVASTKDTYRRKIFSYLLKHLETCRPKDVPQHAEKILPAVNRSNKAELIAVLNKRMTDMTGAQVTRVRKVIREAEKR